MFVTLPINRICLPDNFASLLLGLEYSPENNLDSLELNLDQSGMETFSYLLGLICCDRESTANHLEHIQAEEIKDLKSQLEFKEKQLDFLKGILEAKPQTVNVPFPQMSVAPVQPTVQQPPQSSVKPEVKPEPTKKMEIKIDKPHKKINTENDTSKKTVNISNFDLASMI